MSRRKILNDFVTGSPQQTIVNLDAFANRNRIDSIQLIGNNVPLSPTLNSYQSYNNLNNNQNSQGNGSGESSRGRYSGS